MLSASFYNDGVELGYLELDRLWDKDGLGLTNEYAVRWFAKTTEEDVETQIHRGTYDDVSDLFAMALVEVDAVLSERAVN